VRIKTELDELPSSEAEKKTSIYQTFVSQRLSRASASLSSSPIADFAQSTVLRSIQLGQILFLYNFCPSMSISGVYCQSLAVALRGCLEQAGQSDPSKRPSWAPEILCWVLVNGAITKQESALQAWFLRRVAEFRDVHGLDTFDRLVEMLRKVVWIEAEFGAACRDLWE